MTDGGSRTGWVGRLGSLVAFAVVFVVSLAIGLLLHLNVPAARRVAVREANGRLAHLPSGSVEVNGIERLSLTRVVVRSVDADLIGIGRVHVEHARVGLDTPSMVWSLLAKERVIVIHLRDVEADLVDFTIRPTPNREATGENPKGGRELRLEVDELELAHAYVHGSLANGTPVDVDVDELRSSVSLDDRSVRARFSTAVTARGIADEPLRIALTAAASIPLGPSAVVRSGSLDLVAEAGPVRLRAQGNLLGNSLNVDFEIPETAPDAIRRFWETAPIAAPLSLRGRAAGTLPHLGVETDVTIGSGKARVEAQIDLDQAPSAEVVVSGREIDLHAFTGEAPASRLGFDARAHLRMANLPGKGLPIRGSGTLSNVTGTVAGEACSPVEAKFELDAAGVRATAEVLEKGAPMHIELARRRDGRIDGSLEANAPSLAGVPRLANHGIVAAGRAVLRAEASLVGDVVSVRTTLDVYRVSLGKIAIGGGRIEGAVGGSLRAPRLSAFGHLIALRREPYAANDVVVTARGTPAGFELDLEGRGGTLDTVELHTNVERTRSTSFHDLFARVERGGRAIAIAAHRIDFGPDVTAVDGLRIDGIGATVTVTALRSRDRLVAAIVAPAFDLDRLATVLGLSPDRLGGTGSMHVSLDIGRGGSKADAHVVLSEGRLGRLPKLDAALDLGLEGASWHALFSVRSREFGGVHVESTGILDGSLYDRRSLSGATGRVSLSTDRISVERLCRFVPCPAGLTRAASTMGALVELRADIARGPKEKGGDTRIDVNVDARDARGPLAHLAIDSRVDLLRALAIRSLPDDAPLEAEFAVESRRLEDLPDDLRPLGLQGNVEVQGYAEGTLGKPFFVVELVGAGLRWAGAARSAPSLDARSVTTYDLEQAASDLTVRLGTADVVRASVQVNGSLEHLLSGARGLWKAGAYAELDRFPLSVLPSEAEERLDGNVTGKISLSSLHDKPRVEAHFSVDDLKVGRDSAGPVAGALEANERNCVASLDAGGPSDVANGERGQGALRASAGLLWSAATIPQLDPAAPVEIALDTARFPIAAAQPVLDRWLEHVRGKLDAHLRATGTLAADTKTWVVRGNAHLRDGNVLPIAIGREFKQIEFDLDARETGAVEIQHLTGELGAGRFAGTASFDLHGTTIGQGRAELHIARSQPIPMTLEGVSYGTLWGDISAAAHVTGQDLLVDVRASTLRVELPPQRTADLESLTDDPAILVLQPLRPPERESAMGGGPGPGATRPSRVIFALELGDNVGISREDMKIELTTPPPPENPRLILDGSPLHIDGTVRILGGRVPVAGRVFRIERGVVRFGGSDPENPALDVDAVYEGADTSATRINVHVGGTAKDIKLALTSSPPKAESELLAILAFGEPAPSGAVGAATTQTTASASAAAGPGTAAAGVGSAILTSGINQLLSQSILPIRTSLSTGAATLASASVELTERVRVEYIRQFGATQYGQPLDANQFALNWRFKPRWMLRTVVGDRGTTTLDVLWNRWY